MQDAERVDLAAFICLAANAAFRRFVNRPGTVSSGRFSPFADRKEWVFKSMGNGKYPIKVGLLDEF
jgi:hypothetical protein